MRGVAQQAVREALLSLERGVGLRAVVGEPKDAEAGRSEGCVRVAEETHLLGTLTRISDALALCECLLSGVCIEGKRAFMLQNKPVTSSSLQRNRI